MTTARLQRLPLGGSWRMIFGIAAILALVAWSALGGRPGGEAQVEERAVGAVSEAPVFDGRGKWGGYAR